MEALKNYGHQHPLLMLNEEQLIGNGNGAVDCSRCGEKVSAPCFSCVDCCGFYLHKTCAEAPLELNHLFHRHHPLVLLQNPPSSYTRNLKELEHVALEDPSFSSKNDGGNLDCNVIFHVNCALKEEDYYCIVSQENEDDKSLDIPVNSITKVLETNDDGEATVIEHFTHKHYLMLSDNIREHGTEFFSGSKPFILTSDYMFKCKGCRYLSSGFSYKCNECGVQLCLRCFALSLQDAVKIPGHKHPLLLYHGNEEQCSGCGEDIIHTHSCKDCNFHLCGFCVTRLTTVNHKCDDHLLTLTYDKINDYARYHYCDICEEERDPKHWFYHCKTCDTSAHVDCVLGKYPFIKPGSTFNYEDHPHPLTFVKKIHYYPKCVECGELCEDLSLECAEPECNYIVHWECP
ncbi:Zinc finger ZZ-type and EF-hand domain-containing 1 [Gossypium arboreum]|uniref:Zinc finger ZZ-type and EF-hand domain-containing 1 n=1 Tax=Gossypium arboreum TaxID=29729 RepID=A0A0B0PZV2_GOSAR|nr:Zinc finger ZZ-type and EF-hand domain-containing 1 [Gossypium arboreum]